MSAEEDLVLLYDGLCPFCHGTVRFVLARDPGGRMRFAPLQGEFARSVLSRHPELSGVDSLVLVGRGAESRERVVVRSEAALAIGHYLGGPWRLLGLFRLVPRFLRDRAYDLFATVRYRLLGRYVACPVPDPEVRSRFLS